MRLHRTKPDDLNDPEEKSRYVKNSFNYYNQHLTDINIRDENDINYAMMLVKQVYKKFIE